MDVVVMDMSFHLGSFVGGVHRSLHSIAPVSLGLKRHLGLTKEYAALSLCELDIPFCFVSNPCALPVSGPQMKT